MTMFYTFIHPNIVYNVEFPFATTINYLEVIIALSIWNLKNNDDVGTFIQNCHCKATCQIANQIFDITFLPRFFPSNKVAQCGKTFFYDRDNFSIEFFMEDNSSVA
uniref:Uncharacterized protein n=1 Tax=Romanomermis culicivorax TaxID=13658 RepID=A0A915KWY7_ROMCU